MFFVLSQRIFTSRTIEQYKIVKFMGKGGTYIPLHNTVVLIVSYEEMFRNVGFKGISGGDKECE